MNRQEKTLRAQICQVGKILAEKGLIVASDGNISVRLNKSNLLITPTGLDKGKLKQTGILRIGINSELINLKTRPLPSSEVKMHRAIYQNRADIKAVIHAHPVYATALASAQTCVKTNALNWMENLAEIKPTIGKISLLGELAPGSDELAYAVGEAMKESNVVLLPRHGIVAAGKDLDQARYAVERIELAAKLWFLTEQFNRLRFNDQ
jgi:L-fuculose-phosphate aldolase